MQINYAIKEESYNTRKYVFWIGGYTKPKTSNLHLANKVNWQLFEDSFTPLYCSDNGRPAKPIRLMVALLILKHLHNISDESVVEQWSENVYYQYFCGQKEFIPVEPCEASELVHFRHRIGESGIELILKERVFALMAMIAMIQRRVLTLLFRRRISLSQQIANYTEKLLTNVGR